MMFQQEERILMFVLTEQGTVLVPQKYTMKIQAVVLPLNY